MHSSNQPDKDFILRLAQEAGDVISALRSQLSIDFKGGHELVTQADVAADQLIRERIQQHFPDHAILSEELAPDTDQQAEHLWVIDPIDGTVNYAHQHPQVAISIAYFHNREAKLAVVHNPFLSETFHAQRGQGALLNDAQIHCAATSEMKRAIVATGFPYQKPDLAQLMQRLSLILGSCADVRRLGSAALDICWVACGRLDAYYETVKPWDSAAARLIALEAGAQCGHIHDIPDGENPELWSKDILVTVPALFDALQALLRKADSDD